MKGMGVYGAESYIRGFSGYATELLIIYYGSFLNLIEKASIWKPKVIIDIEKYYKDNREIIKSLGKDKTRSPIIIIDPTFPKRNATASVSTENFAKFIFYSRLLLRDLKENRDITSYFFAKKDTLDDHKNKADKYNTKLLVLEVIGKGNNLDVKNSKVLKMVKFFKKQIEILGFKVLDIEISFSKNLDRPSYIYMYVYPDTLPDYELRFGPPVWVKEDSEKFYEKWKNYEIKVSSDGRLVAITPRKVKKIEEAIEYILHTYKASIENKLEYLSFKIY
jgi:tRNA nucleotidyltransferase (CCA-adding enzyme)